jgi:hypothetical protein
LDFEGFFCFVFPPRFLLKIDGPRTEGEEEKTGGKEERVFVCLLLIAQIYRQSPHLFVEVGRSPRLRALKEGAAAATSRIQHWKFEGGTSEFLRLSCFSVALEEGKQCSENVLVSCRKLVALHLHKERKNPDTPREMFC